MNRDPILFRVDGTPRSGWERLSRCLIFAAALQRRRRPTFFLSQLDPGHLALAIKRGGSEWLEADEPAGNEDDLAETIQEIRRLHPAAVVIDSAHVTESYLEELAATGVLVISIDHQAHLRFPSQLVINPLLEPGRDAYEFHPGSQLLLGRRYAFVRSDIKRVRQMRAQEPGQPFRTVVAMGDDDAQMVTADLARTLLAISRLSKIDLVARPQFASLGKLQELAASHPERIELAIESSEITSRMVRCHFAISNGGSWSLELACVGIPQLILVQNEAHWPNARRLEDEGAAICLGGQETVSPARIRQAIGDLLSDPLERQAMARCGRKLIDGRGPDRLVTALEIMLHPSRSVDFSEAA
jgi:spore coat polysaccharide biosynthesis predicted glycosyltransferase SpsG